jgi:hypothetical protein
VAILDQQIAAIAQLRLLARPFTRQQRIGIAFRFVGLIRAPMLGRAFIDR